MNLANSRVRRIGAVAGIGLIGAIALRATSVGAASPPTSGYTVASPPSVAQVNASALAGVEYIDCQQNVSGSFGSGSGDVPETAGAIVAYGTLAKNNIANLPTANTDPACAGTHNLQTDMTNAVTWLLGQQNATAPSSEGAGGSWTYVGGDQTYATGLALAALSYSSTVTTTPTTAVATAITAGRAFLSNDFQAPPNGVCSTVWASSGDTSYFCGGWNYDADFGNHSDESNTGFAMTGLALTGGVPTALQLVNLGWQTNVQADTLTNPHWAATNNDGGGSYEPTAVDDTNDDFTSNSNDSGSLTFGFADDGLTTADPRVQAALQFDTDALDTLEKAAHSGVSVKHTMVSHNAAAEDGSCDPSAGGCDWALGTGEGGFHYSLFALSKGLGAFITPQLSDGTNWYAKVADLLVGQQDATAGASFGSWPLDPRDDFTVMFATELSVFSLGLVGVPAPSPSASPSAAPTGIPVPAAGVHPGPNDNVGIAVILIGSLALAVALVTPRMRRRGKPGNGNAPRQAP